MPPLPPAPNTLRVSISGKLTGEDSWANVLHCQYGSVAPSLSDVIAVSINVANSWIAHIIPLITSPITTDAVEVTDLASDTGAQSTNVFSTAGGRGDDPIGGQTSMLITYAINRRYKGGHPRTFLLCGGFADLADPGNWHAAFVTEVQNAWRAFLAGWLHQTVGGTTLNGLVMVSYTSKFVNPVPPYRRPTPLITPIDETKAVTQAELATQRRRVRRKT